VIGDPVHIDRPESRETRHPGGELLPDRLIETEFLALEIHQVLRLELAPLGHVARLDDVARDHAQQHEDQHRDPEQGRDHQQQPLDEVVQQGRSARRRSPRRRDLSRHSESQTTSSVLLR
jgi:hypothetical protein